MFYHVKELQFNARVSKPDPRFARLLLEQFGGGNGELKAAMQYFVQAFACKNTYPDKYDLLMDIATEEFSHLEIVGATITMLLSGVNGEMKNAVETSAIGAMMNGNASKEDLINEAFYYPQFCSLTAGGPTVTDSNGAPWSGAFVNANGDLTVDLRSNIAAESRAKIVYEYLMKFTDDPYVKETLAFLMTREITHFQQFEAALETIEPNFPPGILQQDARYGNLYFNLSKGEDASGPWNEGEATRTGDKWRTIDEVQDFVESSNGLLDVEPEDVAKTPEELQRFSKKLAKERSKEIKDATEMTDISWCDFS
jgi:Mn-containing catalase